MFETVRDLVALLEYRKVLSERFGQAAPDMLVNYVADVPDFLAPHARRPEIAEFDGELYIMGDVQDLPFYCAYIKQHPGTEYNISVFTTEDQARDRAVAMHGFDPEDALALAPMRVPETVSESLLEAFGEPMSEARYGMFTRSGNKDAMDNRKQDPFAQYRTVSSISSVIKSSIVDFDAKKVNKAPLLIGHSGISKSATIKAVIKELNAGTNEAAGNWGYRLVDIRAAFFDKMDLLGMITLTSETDGSDGSLEAQMNERWSDSPKLELLTCTTAFVESCRAMVTKIDNGEVKVTENDAEFEKRLREYAKTPVMFFDEINRTPKEVMNQLMVMINGHALNDYDISIAPKLAAANLPVEMEKLDELEPEAYEKLIYLVQNVNDAAKIDRFIPYVISSDDVTVQKGAYGFLQEQETVTKHPVLQELVQYGFDNQILHDISAMDTDGKFPTFRGWEDLTKYLSWCLDNDEQPLLAIIKGLLGEKTASELTRQLEASGVSVDVDTDSTSRFVDHTYRSGLPMMLLGRMGIAKTAKINKAIKDNGDEAIRIDLSSTDRVNVGGFPRPAPFLREAFGFGFKEGSAATKEEALGMKLAAVQSPLFEAFEDEVKAAGEVPHQTTSYIPNKQLQDKLDQIRSAQGDGKKLVLVFDEINRCTPVVQSAVFEAISDKRLFGCDLSGIDYSVVAAGNYDDSEGFDAESGDMGGAFDAAPIDTATMHRFATQIIREVGEEDLDEFLAYLEETFPAAHAVAKKLDRDQLLDLLNAPYDMNDDGDEEGGLAKPVFTMRTLQSIHNMLTATHNQVYAFMAMDAAAEAVPAAQANKARADALIAIYDDPRLILWKEDKGMNFPASKLRQSGLSEVLGLPKAGIIPAKDLFATLRDFAISISNDDQTVIDQLEQQFGSVDDFLFRAQSLIRDLESSLSNTGTQLTYKGVIPEYAMDIVGEAIEEFYIEESVKAAKGVLFDEMALFDESLGDEVLAQLINQFMASVASEATLNFNTLFMNMIIETLDKHPDLTPSATHLARLRDLFNDNPLAAARPLSKLTFTKFLSDYQNKVSGATAVMEAMSKISIELKDWPLVVDAVKVCMNAASIELDQVGVTSSSLDQRIEKALAKGFDVIEAARKNDHEAYIYGHNLHRSKEEALQTVDGRGIDGMQALTLASLWTTVFRTLEMGRSTFALRHKVREGSVTFGTVTAHDGHQYPDYNQLCVHSMERVGTVYNNNQASEVGAIYALVMRNAFTLARLEPASASTRRVAQNSDWYVDAVYKTNHAGAAVELRAPDVLAIGDQSLVTPSLPGVTEGEDRFAYMSTAMLASAKAATGGNPAIHPAFMGAEGVGNLKYLTQLNADDMAFSAAFLQLNYDVTLTEKGSRKAAAKASVVEMLRRPDATDELDQDKVGFTDAEKMFALLGQSRVPLVLNPDETKDAVLKELMNLKGYLTNDIVAAVEANKDAIDTTTQQKLHSRSFSIKQFDQKGVLKRMANTFKGIWN